MWEYCFPLCAAEAPPQLLQGKAPKGSNLTGTAFPESIRGFPAWGRCAEDFQQGNVQNIPIIREMCRTFTPNETQGVWKCSEEVLWSKSKHRHRAVLQKTQLSNKIPQLLLELPGGSLGAEAAAEPLCQELPLLPQPSLGTRAPQTFTTTSSHCSVSSAKLQPLKEKPGMQRWHFLLQWETSKTWRQQQPSPVHCLLSTCHAVGHAH